MHSMARRRGQTIAASMPHGKIYNPAKFCEIMGARSAPEYDPDHILESALEHVRHKTGLGYRLFEEFTRDFPKVRDAYSGEELKRYDARIREIYFRLKHRDGKYMAQFALCLSQMCEAAVRAYRRRRAYDPNARRPRCKNPVLRQAALQCIIRGNGFSGRLPDAPNMPLLAAPYVTLLFPVTPYGHMAKFRLTPNVVERIATAVSVGAVTVNGTTLSIAYEPQPVTPIPPKGLMGMDVNKREHTTASTDGTMGRIPNKALGLAQERRRRHATLGVTGGKPKKKRSKARTKPHGVKHPGRKPKNKGNRSKKRRDERVNRRERNRINARFVNRKNDWLFKLMHALAAMGYALVLEESTINRLLVKSNKMMSREERDLLKMGLSQGRIRAVADGVLAKYGLSVYGITPAGTSSECPKCSERLWAAKYGTKVWKSWKRTKACVPCLYYVDRDNVAGINILCRGMSAYEPGVGPEPSCDGGDGRRVTGDWEQRVPRLVQRLLDAVAVRFPHVVEGRRPKGDAKNPSYGMGDARSLDGRLDVSNRPAGLGPPGETPAQCLPDGTVEPSCADLGQLTKL